jgi:hypothetical protein
MTDIGDVLRIYRGSDGDATAALYRDLEALGPVGAVAVNLFRACKASERAKTYRRDFSREAYGRKQWAMDNLCNALTEHAAVIGDRWGWGVDDKQPVHRHVLYIDLPTGQVSFHSAVRGRGPDYAGAWDGRPAQSADRICRWLGRLFADTYAEESCPGHVASERDAKICGRCGIHIDSLRPDEAQ